MSAVSKKVDAEIERAQHRGGGFVVVALAVELAHPHAAETHAGDDRALRTQRDLVHVAVDLTGKARLRRDAKLPRRTGIR